MVKCFVPLPGQRIYTGKNVCAPESPASSASLGNVYEEVEEGEEEAEGVGG